MRQESANMRSTNPGTLTFPLVYKMGATQKSGYETQDGYEAT